MTVDEAKNLKPGDKVVYQFSHRAYIVQGLATTNGKLSGIDVIPAPTPLVLHLDSIKTLEVVK